jgi:GcrA cell cycle regulator
MSQIWPQEKTDSLVKMVTKNTNVKLIAKELGVTPSIISSKLSRLRRAGVLPFPEKREVKIREKLPKPPKEPKPKKAKKPEPPPAESTQVASDSPDSIPNPTPAPVPPHKKPSKRKKVATLPQEEEEKEDEQPPRQPKPLRPLEMLGNRDCRWPLGDPRSPDFKFCGKRIEANQSGPYCREHHHLAFQHYSRPVASAAD